MRDGVSCVHRWLIDTPAGPTSTGVCQVCGKVKQFSNGFVEPSTPYGTPRSRPIEPRRSMEWVER